MAIKLADEIIEEIKNSQPVAVTDVSVNGEELIYIYRIILLKGIAVNYTLFLISYSLL